MAKFRYWLVFAPKYAASTFLLFAHNRTGSTSLRDYSGGRARKLVSPSVAELFATAKYQLKHDAHLTTDVSYWQSEIAGLNARYLGAELLAPSVAGGDNRKAEDFDSWLARWRDVGAHPGATVPDLTSRIDAVLALWEAPVPGPWKRGDDQQLLGSCNRRGDAKLPRNGEHSIEAEILDEADGQVVCCGERLVDGLSAMPLSRDGAGGRKGNVEADLLLLTSSGGGYAVVLAEVKHTDGSAWSAAVQNLLQLRLFTLSESARLVLGRRSPRLILPDDVPVRGLVVAPAAFYSAPGKKTAGVEAARRLLARFRAIGVTVDLATWDSTRRVIAPLPLESTREASHAPAPQVSQDARARARSALRAAFVASGGVCLETGHLGYAASARANALDVPDLTWDHIVQDFMGGAGGELEARDGSPPKLSAIHSSAMLAVNTFGRWRLEASSLSISGLLDGGATLSFERQCRSSLLGIPPTLDVVVESGTHVLAIESKLLEPLSLKVPAFATSYEAVFESLGKSPWRDRYQRIRDGLDAYKRLDVAQLLKHFLGLRATFHGRSVTLLYLFWEPVNAAAIPEYGVHAQELVRFADGLEDEKVQFRAMTYPQLWQAWGSAAEPSLLEHVRYLKGRYTVAI